MAIYATNGIHTHPIEVEFETAALIFNGLSKIIISKLHPPHSKLNVFLTKLKILLLVLRFRYPSILIAGDFNIDLFVDSIKK